MKITRTATIAALTLASPLAHAADWTLETAQDKATYQDVAILHQASSNSISDEYAMKEVQPRLELRCAPMSGEDVSVRIDWQRFISSFNTEVQFAADERDAVTVKMGVDRSNKITSTKDTSDDDALLGYLDGASELNVTVTPYSEVPVTVKYSLDGLGEKLDELRKACEG